MNRDEMLAYLRNTDCIVKFIKADGSERIMYCTLQPNSIPESMKPKGSTSPIKENKEVIRVFDTEIEEWRSFKVASVLSFSHV